MLKLENISFYQKKYILKNINLKLGEKEYHVILGPTGAGKSTVLKIISGIYKIKEGRIFLNNRDITYLEPEKRNIGYIPQNYALFPHLSVKENIIFGMKIKKYDNILIENRLIHLSKLLNIEDLLQRKIDNLSGGEKQRIAIARALAIQPELLLLDEPFSAIDENFRKYLWFQIKKVIKSLKIPVIHITHNIDEAFAVGDRISILMNGKLVESGNKVRVYEKPVTPEIASFLGYKNIFKGEIISIDKRFVTIKIKNKFLIKIKNIKEKNMYKAKEIKICIREQDIKILKENKPIRDELKNNVYKAKIINLIHLSNTVIVEVTLFKDIKLTFIIPSYVYKRFKLKVRREVKIAFWEPGLIIW